MDRTVSFTSEYVCNKLAREAVVGLEAGSILNARQFTHDLLIPIGSRLSMGQRMPRGVLKQMLDRIVAKLNADPGVVSVQYDVLTKSKLSANEEHRLVYVLASAAEGDEDWVSFVATEVIVSRKELRVSSTTTDFSIHRHALARYMHRELKPTENMMGDLFEAIQASVIISMAVMGTDTGNIAIPMKDGMLFGRIKRVNNSLYPAPRNRFVFNRKKPELTEENRETLLDGKRIVVEAMTYVDWNSLTPARERLRGVIRRFMDEHAFGIRQCFEISYYESTVLTEKDDDPRPAIKTAIEASIALTKTPEWRSYEDNFGANG